MKRFALVLLLAAAFCCSAFAQSTDDTPASKEDVQRYFAVVKSNDMIKKLMGTMTQSMHQLIHEQYLKHQDELPADYESKVTSQLDEIYGEMPMQQIMEAMIPAYQKHMTKGDIDNIIAFYSTPTGAKLIRELPEIMAEAMQDMMPVLSSYMDSVRAKIQKQTDDMIAQNKKPAATKAPAANN